MVTSADVVRARRYATGLDPQTNAGGPFSSPLPSPNGEPEKAGRSKLDTTERTMLVGKAISGDGRVTVPMELASAGDEVAAGFTLDFDAAILSNPQIILANRMPADAVLTFNTNDEGHIRVLVDSTEPLLRSQGESPIVFVTFDILAGAGLGPRWASAIHLRLFDLSDAL